MKSAIYLVATFAVVVIAAVVVGAVGRENEWRLWRALRPAR